MKQRAIGLKSTGTLDGTKILAISATNTMGSSKIGTNYAAERGKHGTNSLTVLGGL